MRTKQLFSTLKNRFFVMLICLYVVLLLFASFMTCYYSYHQKREALLSQINRPYIQLAQEYRNITDNFWQLYMPFFESQSKVPNVLKITFLPNHKFPCLHSKKKSWQLLYHKYLCVMMIYNGLFCIVAKGLITILFSVMIYHYNF